MLVLSNESTVQSPRIYGSSSFTEQIRKMVTRLHLGTRTKMVDLFGWYSIVFGRHIFNGKGSDNLLAGEIAWPFKKKKNSEKA